MRSSCFYYKSMFLTTKWNCSCRQGTVLATGARHMFMFNSCFLRRECVCSLRFFLLILSVLRFYALVLSLASAHTERCDDFLSLLKPGCSYATVITGDSKGTSISI